MRIGIVNRETWSFLHEIHADLKEHHTTSLFEFKAMPLPFLNPRLNALAFHRAMRTFLRSNDVVFFEWSSELLAEASRMPKTCGIVTRLHRYEMYGLADTIRWDGVDRIILVSQAKKNEFLERFPEQAAKIAVVPEAVDPGRFTPSNRPFSGDIGILCHLTPRKRVYELVLAFSELHRANSGLRLHIGGGPRPDHLDYYDALLSAVSALGLEDAVTFYGNVADPASWYRGIDIFVSNSYSEGLQVAPMEAMASGCYTLSHRWNGAEELLPEPYLYYTDRQLSEKILAYCDLSEAEKSAEKAHMRAIVCEKFNVHDTKVRVRQVIESAAKTNAA